MRRLGAVAAMVAHFAVAAAVSRADETAPPPVEAGLFDRDSLTGDWSGYRKKWEDAGVQLGGDEIFEGLANPLGGRAQGEVVEGRFELFANIDLDKVAGWSGATFHANAYQIHGRGLSANDLGNLLTVSNIEAQRSTRLFTLWLQQELLDHALSIRAGQIAADDEFYVSQYAALFINSTFGWPAILGTNLPSGGPAYPLATPGLRVREAISPALTIAAAAFNGDPADPGPGNPQLRDASGTDFRVNGDRFVIGEIAYGTIPDPDSGGLPGTVKLGSWYHSGRFADQHFDTTGLSLANPLSTGVPASHRGDYGAYFIADQMLWRAAGTSEQGLATFFRIAGNPADRNLIEFHADTGLSYKGLLPGRDDDTFGIGGSYARISTAERAAARDLQGFTQVQRPIPDFEAALEATYQVQIAPWWLVQPDAQFIFHPGARTSDLSGTPQITILRDALVIGLRTAIIF